MAANFLLGATLIVDNLTLIREDVNEQYLKENDSTDSDIRKRAVLEREFDERVRPPISNKLQDLHKKVDENVDGFTVYQMPFFWTPPWYGTHFAFFFWETCNLHI